MDLKVLRFYLQKPYVIQKLYDALQRSLPLGIEFQNPPDAKHITVHETDMNFSESQSYVAVVLGGWVSDACRHAVRLKTAVVSDRRA